MMKSNSPINRAFERAHDVRLLLRVIGLVSNVTRIYTAALYVEALHMSHSPISSMTCFHASETDRRNVIRVDVGIREAREAPV